MAGTIAACFVCRLSQQALQSENTQIAGIDTIMELCALVNAVSVGLRKGPSESPSCTTPSPMSPPTTVPSVRSSDT